MARAAASEIRAYPGEYLELVQRGGTITIVEGEEIIGELTPTDEARRQMLELVSRLPEDHATILQPLVSDQHIPHTRIQHILKVLGEAAATLAVRPPFSKDFFTRTRPRFDSGSVLEALLEERRDSQQ